MNIKSDNLEKRITDLQQELESLKEQFSQEFPDESLPASQNKKPHTQQLADSPVNTDILYNAIIQSTEQGYVMTEKTGHIIDANAAYCNMVGYKKAELLGQPISIVEKNETAEEIENRILQLINSEKQQHFETIHTRKDGSTVDVSVNLLYIDYHGGIYISFVQNITEEKHAREEIVESKNKLQIALEASKASIFENNFATGEVNLTPELFMHLGYTNEEIPKSIDEMLALIHKDDRPKAMEEIAKHAEGESQEYYAEFRMKSKIGKWHWVDGRGKVIKRTDNGKPEILLGISSDITGKKHTELQLKDSENRLKLALQINVTSQIELDTETGKLFISPDLFLKIGFTENQIPQTLDEFIEIIYPEDRESAINNYERHISGEIEEYSNEYRITAPQGQLHWLNERGKTIEWTDDGKPKRVLGIAQDITERKNTEISFHQFEHIVSTSTDSLALIDKNYQYRTANYAYANDWKKKPSDFNGVKLTDIFGEEQFKQKIKPHIDECLTGKTVKFGEWIVFPGNKLRYLDMCYDPYINNRGELDGFVVASRDSTELKQIELELKKQNVELILAKEKAEESDKLKSSFLANMSHEIRTPMNGILGFADLLNASDMSEEEQQSYINIIKESGTRMLGIINDLVDISKLEAGQVSVKKEVVHINEQLEFVYKFFLPEVNERNLGFIIEDHLLKETLVYTDKEKLYAILINLVKNAIKYSDTGTIRLGCLMKGEELHFFVKDQGIGIPAEKTDSIFDRFVQADIYDSRAAQGAGLGLAISKAYAQLLEGNLWVESIYGKGSCFWLSIPYDRTNIFDKTQLTDPVLNKPLQKEKLKILLAEDDKVSAMLIEHVLRDIDCELTIVDNGKAAVNFIEENMETDIILMDVKMPLMNGYEATQTIRAFNKNVFIIAQSAFAFEADKQKAINVGCNTFISKPIDKTELISIIRKVAQE